MALVAILFGWTGAEARPVRVATWNVELGIGTPGSAKYEAQKDILRRVNADIVAFQELGAPSSNEWVRLAGELGYPYRAWGRMGFFAGDLVVGYFSRFPIVEVRSVESPPGAQEMTRLPMRIAVRVPGAARTFTLWTVHLKAEFKLRDCFRRAVESSRVFQDLAAYRKRFPDRTEYIVLGDMNDDPARSAQPVEFTKAHPEVPFAYRLGKDIGFPLRYRAFPGDRFGEAGLAQVEAWQTGSRDPITHRLTNLRLDYIFVSPAVRNSASGAPRAEVYYSEGDGPDAGMPKGGEFLAAGRSQEASDHYPVFADLHLEDAPPLPAVSASSK